MLLEAIICYKDLVLYIIFEEMETPLTDGQLIGLFVTGEQGVVISD